MENFAKWFLIVAIAATQLHHLCSRYDITISIHSQAKKSNPKGTHCVSLSTTYVLYSIVCTQSIGLNQSAMSMFWFSASTTLTLTYTTHCLHPIENFIVIHRVYTCLYTYKYIPHRAECELSRAHTRHD